MMVSIVCVRTCACVGMRWWGGEEGREKAAGGGGGLGGGWGRDAWSQLLRNRL